MKAESLRKLGELRAWRGAGDISLLVCPQSLHLTPASLAGSQHMHSKTFPEAARGTCVVQALKEGVFSEVARLAAGAVPEGQLPAIDPQT